MEKSKKQPRNGMNSQKTTESPATAPTSHHQPTATARQTPRQFFEKDPPMSPNEINKQHIRRASVPQRNFQGYETLRPRNRRHRHAIEKCEILEFKGQRFLKISARENYYYLSHHRRVQQLADDSTKTRHTPARTLTRTVHDADA